MAKKFYLMSGPSAKGGLKHIDGRALADADNKNILVLNLASYQNKEIQDKREFFEKYFREVGAEDVAFIEKETPEEKTKEEFERAGLLYLPGGNPSALINHIKKKGLVAQLKSFKGVISGNGAGAYALCPVYLRTGRNPEDPIPSLGIISIWIKANYNTRFDPDLERLSKKRSIYAIKDRSAIIYDKRPKFIGNVWKFSNGAKTKVN